MSSLVLCFYPFSPTRFIKQSPEKTEVWLLPSEGLWSSKVYFEHQRGNISVSSRLVSDPSLAQPGVPSVNIWHLSKLPEGWERNAFHLNAGGCYRVTQDLCCVNEKRELFGFGVGSESVTTCRTASWGHYSWAAPTVPGTQKKQPWTFLSCCYKKASLLIKSEWDLRGKGKGTSTLVLADIWELPSSGCNWAFFHLSLPWSLLAGEAEFLGPKSSLTYLQV